MKLVTLFLVWLYASSLANAAPSKAIETYLLYPPNTSRSKQIWIGPEPIAAKTIPGDWTFYKWTPVDGDSDASNYTPVEGALVHSAPVIEVAEPTPEAITSNEINKELQALRDDTDLTDAQYAELKAKLERARDMSDLAAKKAKLEEAQQAKADAKTKTKDVDVNLNLNLKPVKPRVVIEDDRGANSTFTLDFSH